MSVAARELREELNQSLHGEGLEVAASVSPEQAEILTPEALRFLLELGRRFDPVRRSLLEKRRERQLEFDAGKLPDFLPETKQIRESEWTVAPIPADLQDRRVEITGPVDRKMIINALNSGAQVFMADFEDSTSPTWENLLEGQRNLRDAVAGRISFTSPEGKKYALQPKTATLMVRPRGWHLPERHLLLEGQPFSASLFDFALFLFHNAKALLGKGTAPYFYLPKMQSHLEARLWNDVFLWSQKALGIPVGTIRATVLIETLPAAFEMDEILYELREHSAGLNCGRWDYIFSFLKTFRNRPEFALPDRARVTMDRAFLAAYVRRLVRVCHRRGIHAMGGMAAQIPIKNDSAANEAAMEKVRQDKLREVKVGHDGTWVAHPGLVPVARAVFDEHMSAPNQIGRSVDGPEVTVGDLLEVPKGEITEEGLRTNVSVGLQYLESWLRGSGCVPIRNLMEDAATAEISRTQVWHWVRHRARLSDGRRMTPDLVWVTIGEELARIRESMGEEAYSLSRYELAAEIFEEMMTGDRCADFMTIEAYERLE